MANRAAGTCRHTNSKRRPEPSGFDRDGPLARQTRPAAVRSADRRRAIVDSFVKLNPVTLAKNPVMFVVEVGAALTTVLLVRDARRQRGAASASSSRSPPGSGSPCCSPTSPKPWRKAAARRRPTACARPRPDASAKKLSRQRQRSKSSPPSSLRKGDVVPLRAGRPDPRRRRRDRRHRQRRRIGHHRRKRAGDSRIRRRPQRRHRRHQGAVRLHQGPDHLQPRRDVSRPHDRPGRRRAAAEDAQRNRAQHPDRRADADLPAGRGHARAVRAVQRRPGEGRHRPDRHRCWSRCWSA